MGGFDFYGRVIIRGSLRAKGNDIAVERRFVWRIL